MVTEDLTRGAAIGLAVDMIASAVTKPGLGNTEQRTIMKILGDALADLTAAGLVTR